MNIELQRDFTILTKVMNAVMWSRPRHPFWLFHIKRLVENVQSRFYGQSPWAPTYLSAYEGLLDYAKEYPDDSPRRDLVFWSYKHADAPISSQSECPDALPQSQDSSICNEIKLYFVLNSNPKEIVAFYHNGMHQQGRNPFMKYINLWFFRQVYCDDRLWFFDDPCIQSPDKQDSQLVTRNFVDLANIRYAWRHAGETGPAIMRLFQY